MVKAYFDLKQIENGSKRHVLGELCGVYSHAVSKMRRCQHVASQKKYAEQEMDHGHKREAGKRFKICRALVFRDLLFHLVSILAWKSWDFFWTWGWNVLPKQQKWVTRTWIANAPGEGFTTLIRKKRRRDHLMLLLVVWMAGFKLQHIYTYIYVCVCICVYICIYMYVCVCICIQ